MAKKNLVTKVWIVDGCIVCDACETAAPDVFEVLEETCIVRPAALEVSFNKPRTENIIEAAEECPVDVIKFETVEEEVPDDVAETVPASGEGAESDATAAVVAKPGAPAKAAETAKPTKKEAPADPKPATPQKAPTSAAAAAASAKTSMAGDVDPAIAALLKAAKTRGGDAGILRASESVPDAAKAWQRMNPKELPPDARQARVMKAARKSSKNPSRREFASGAALAVGWTAFGIGAGTAIGPAFGRFMMPNVLEEPDPRVRVGKIQKYIEMEPGGVNEDYKPQGIWMIREEEGIAALNIICTHLGCIPNWLANDRKFKCPCHGSGYYPNGINFEGPTPRPLERFRITIEKGLVVVDKSKKFQFELGQWGMPGSFLPV